MKAGRLSFSRGNAKVDEQTASQVGNLAGGLNLPGLT